MRPSGRRRACDVVEVGKQVQTGVNVVTVGQPAPVMLMDVPRGEPVAKIALADTGEDGLRGVQFDCVGRAVNPPCVALQIFGESQCLQQGDFGDIALPDIGDVIDQGQRRNQLAIFRKVAFECRR